MEFCTDRKCLLFGCLKFSYDGSPLGNPGQIGTSVAFC